MYERNDLYRWRFWLLVIVLIGLTLALIVRMVDLAVFKRKFLLQQSNRRIVRLITLPAYRGMITDRRGEALAVSTPVMAVCINPSMFIATHLQKKRLVHWLGYKSLRILNQRISRYRHRSFMYLKRNVTPLVAAEIKKLRINGLFFERAFHRYYPHGPASVHVIGRTNVDDQGQEGLELAYNKWLKGAPGKEWVVKDRLGHVINSLGLVKATRSGHALTLSLDQRIQYIAYQSLQSAVTKVHAKSGTVVVLDVKTGEVLAMVNIPSYNPNRRRIHFVAGPQYRNQAVTDVFEPGSTMKTFAIVSALMSGRYSPSTLINTNPGYMTLEGHKISDEGLNYGIISLTEILKRSSNVGISKVTLSLPAESLIRTLRDFGFGQRTATGFPGEANGVLPQPIKWDPFVLATLSFGYGISSTALQLARAYAILANDGVRVPISFLKLSHPIAAADQRRIITSHVAHQILTMLHSVVKTGGTGYLARVLGYQIGGKTGTAYVSSAHGYDTHHYLASFVGIAPLSKPRLVVVVIINQPDIHRHYGGIIAAPVFSKVMAGALKFYNVAASGKAS